MPRYYVKAGDSPTAIAGRLWNDQRQYQLVEAASGGRMLKPGDWLDLPDAPPTANPVITQAAWAAAPVGYSATGQPQYRQQPAQPRNLPAVPAFEPQPVQRPAPQPTWATRPAYHTDRAGNAVLDPVDAFRNPNSTVTKGVNSLAYQQARTSSYPTPLQGLSLEKQMRYQRWVNVDPAWRAWLYGLMGGEAYLDWLGIEKGE